MFAIQTGGFGGGKFGGGTESAKPADKNKEIKQLADAIVQAVKDAQPKAKRTVKLASAESILIDAISETVSTLSSDYGTSLTCVGGVLIVKAPEAVNEKVESFVEDLTFSMKAAAEKR